MNRSKNNQENNRKTILVVDDEETLTWSMSKNLSMNKQYKVICANSTEEASRILKKASNIDLVVSDIKLGGKSGFELLDEVKAHYPQLGFIVMTAYGSDENKHKALEKGALRYIEKPFGMDSMIKVIGEVLEEMEQLLQPEARLKSRVKNHTRLANILSHYPQDINELVFIKLNSMDGEVLFQVGVDLAPVSLRDILPTRVVNKIREICQQLKLGKLELIAISTEKHYILLKPIANQQLFLYSLVGKELGFGKALYVMEHLALKIGEALKSESLTGRHDNED